MGNSSSKSRLRAQLATAEAYNAALRKELAASKNEHQDALDAALNVREKTRLLEEQLLVEQETAKNEREEAEKGAAALEQDVISNKTSRDIVLREAQSLRERVHELEDQTRTLRNDAIAQQEQSKEEIERLQREVEIGKVGLEESLSEKTVLSERCRLQVEQFLALQDEGREEIAELQSKIYRKSEELLILRRDANGLDVDKSELMRQRDNLTEKLEDAKKRLQAAGVEQAKLQEALGLEQEKVRAQVLEKEQILRREEEALKAKGNFLEQHAKELELLKARLAESMRQQASMTPPPQANESRPLGASSSKQTTFASITQNHNRDYRQPYDFSQPTRKHPGCTQRVAFGPWQGEMRVEIREWFRSSRTTRGVSLPVADAQKLAAVLPEVVRQAEAERGRQGLY